MSKFPLVNRVSGRVKQFATQRIDDQLERLPQIPVMSKLVHKTKRRFIVDVDVLVIGAGIAGVAMAVQLNKSRKHGRYMVLERRQDMGGTWDLFQYPGIRSDSDVFTFGFADRPWKSKKTFASGQQIKDYIKQTAEDTGVHKNIRYGKKVEHIDWSSELKYWKVTVKDVATGKIEEITSRFVVGATGYYNYDQGYQPTFAKQKDFAGLVIHPQKWHKDINYHDKRVVVIGSGATAVTLLPALLNKEAKQQAAHVTMLQRSPSYIAAQPSQENLVELLSDKLGILSAKHAHQFVRWRNIGIQQATYRLSVHSPKVMKTLMKYGVKRALKGSDVSMEHFSPKYDPWDERVCAVPDGDLFKSIKTDKATVVTDEIEFFTKTGIKLKSGKHLDADIIVTATGLNVQMLGGATVSIDGEAGNVGEKMTYKAVMVEDTPNLAVLFGYTNASWTLKIDIASAYISRLLNHMALQGYKVVTPVATSKIDAEVAQRQPQTVMGALSSGYVKRAYDVLPKQGDRYPWRVTNNYITDRIMLLHRKIDDKWLRFER